MRDLNRILKAGDVENALLSNSAKDSETMNDNVLDTLLDNANNMDRKYEKGLDIIERLTAGSASSSRPRVYSSRPQKRPKSAKKPPSKKAAKPKPKAKAAKKSRKR